MLPKDLLKYARKFTAEEIRKAIIDAINGINNVREFAREYLEKDYMDKLHEYMRQTEIKRRNEEAWGRLPQPLTNPYSTPYTTTGGFVPTTNAFTSTSIANGWNYSL